MMNLAKCSLDKHVADVLVDRNERQRKCTVSGTTGPSDVASYTSGCSADRVRLDGRVKN